MLSRVAESLYWMSRYVERAENVARFVDVNLNLMLETDSGRQQWMPLVSTNGDQEWFEQKYGTATQESVISFLAFDEENPNSIISCLRSARENARSIREVISSEMWESLNTFYLFVDNCADHPKGIAGLHGFFSKVKNGSHAFAGVTDATMTHGEAWHFMKMGRTIERADKTSRILDTKYYILLPSVGDVGSPVDEIQWTAVLRSVSALEMYRKRHGSVLPKNIVQFLVLDNEFPRAIRSCLDHAKASLHSISGTPVGECRSKPERLLSRLSSELASMTVEDISAGGLHEFIDNVQQNLNLVCMGIYETFFVRRAPVVKLPVPVGRGLVEQ